MELISAKGRYLYLNSDEKDAFYNVFNILQKMHAQMNDDDICIFIDQMRTADCSDLSENKLFEAFSCEEYEACDDFLCDLANFLYAIADGARNIK